MGFLGALGRIVGGGASVLFPQAAIYSAEKQRMFPWMTGLLGAARARSGWTEIQRGVPRKAKKGLGSFPQDSFDWDENFKQAYDKR